MSFWKTLFGVKEKTTKATSQAPKATQNSDAKPSNLPPLCEAAKAGNPQEVQRLLSDGSDRDVSDEKGNCALHYAAVNGHANIVEILLAAGANVNAKNKNGGTPLHSATTLHTEATLKGRLAVAKTLMLGKGADTEARDNFGWTPLHTAVTWAQADFGDLIRELVESGADLEATILISGKTPSEFAKLSGMTALELARGLGKPDCAKALIAVGAKSKP